MISVTDVDDRLVSDEQSRYSFEKIHLSELVGTLTCRIQTELKLWYVEFLTQFRRKEDNQTWIPNGDSL